MRRISEDEAWAAAGDAEPPLLAKAEWDPTQSAVALKRWPEFYVLGLSCDLDDRFELYAFEAEDAARAAYEQCCGLMQSTGRPFSD